MTRTFISIAADGSAANIIVPAPGAGFALAINKIVLYTHAAGVGHFEDTAVLALFGSSAAVSITLVIGAKNEWDFTPNAEQLADNVGLVWDQISTGNDLSGWVEYETVRV